MNIALSALVGRALCRLTMIEQSGAYQVLQMSHQGTVLEEFEIVKTSPHLVTVASNIPDRDWAGIMCDALNDFESYRDLVKALEKDHGF
jgi:hypothetical protein